MTDQENINSTSPKPVQRSSSSLTKIIVLSIIGVVFTSLIAFFSLKIIYCFMKSPSPLLSRNTFINWRITEANKEYLQVYKYIKSSAYDPKEYNGATYNYIQKAQAQFSDPKDDKSTLKRLGLYHDGNKFVFPRKPINHHTLITKFEEDQLLRFHASVRSLFVTNDEKDENGNITIKYEKNNTLQDINNSKDNQLGGDLLGRMPKKFLQGKELPKSEMKLLAINITDSKKYDEIFIPLIKQKEFKELKQFIEDAHILLKAGYKDNETIDITKTDNKIFEKTKKVVKDIYEPNDYFHDTRPILEKKQKGIDKMKDIDGQIKEFYNNGSQALWSPAQTHFFSQLLFQFRYLTFDTILKKPSNEKDAGDRDLRVTNALSFIFASIYPETKREEASFMDKFFRPNSKDLPEEKKSLVKDDAEVLWKAYDERVKAIIEA